MGMHIELAKRALTKLTLPYSITSMVWNRCMEGGKAGYYDAVLSASYRDYRAVDFYFPEDAKTAQRSKWRLTQAEYVVVVRTDAHFEWDGAEVSLPQPVGLPLGYATVNVLQEKGVTVFTTYKYTDLFRMLHQGRINSMLVVKQAADMYLSEAPYKDQLATLERPYRSTSYFMIFSKKGRVSPERARMIWQEVADAREDTAIMKVISDTVKAQVSSCFNKPKACNY